jgi:hypothetical protein
MVIFSGPSLFTMIDRGDVADRLLALPASLLRQHRLLARQAAVRRPQARRRTRARRRRSRHARRDGRSFERTPSYEGVYQTGEVQARSWCFIGTSGGILMLKRTES